MTSEPPGVLFVPAHVIPPRHPSAVVTIHDVAYRAHPRAFSLRERTELDTATRWNIRAADAIIAVSRTTRNDLVAHYGVDPGRVYVIHHGVSSRFRPASSVEISEVRERLSLDRPFLLALGTLHDRKNYSVLLDAFARINDPLGELDLVIAGANGDAANTLRRQAATMKAADRIHFPGYVSAELLSALYSAAELFILPSWYEGFGMPMLEAMACGTPVIAASAGALPEIGGAAAEFVDPADSVGLAHLIETILVDSTHQRQMIDRGNRHAREFTWKRSAMMTLRVLRAVRDKRELTEESLGWLDASLRFATMDSSGRES